MLNIQRIFNVMLVLAFLTVAGCAGTQTSRSTGTYIDDKTISTKVEAQLAADSITQAIQVEVETYNGIVQLSGFVDTEDKKERAAGIAQKVQGVKEVKNDLVIRK